MKKYIVIFLLVALVGCGSQSFSKDHQLPVSGNIVVDNVKYEMRTLNYQWNGEKAKIERVDELSPLEAAKDFETLPLEKNKLIDIVIEKNPSLIIHQWTEDGKVNEIPITDNQITLPSTSGHYIYEVVGKWDDGEASYIFDVEVK